MVQFLHSKVLFRHLFRVKRIPVWNEPPLRQKLVLSL